LGSSSIGILAATKEEKGQFNRILGLDGSFVLSGNDLVDIQVASGQVQEGNNKNKAFVLSYLRTGDLFGVTGKLEKVEPFFEINRLGYIQKEFGRGWNKANGVFRVSPRINKHKIRRIIANVEWEYNQDLFSDEYINHWLDIYPVFIPDAMFGNVVAQENERYIGQGTRRNANFQAGGDISVNTMNEMIILAGYKRLNATELTGEYAGTLWNFNCTTKSTSKGARVAGIFDATFGTLYNFQQKYVGHQQSFSIDGEGRLGRNFLSKLQGGYVETQNPEGEKDGRYFKISSNSTLMFTKHFYLRLHAQGIFGTTWYDQKQIYNEYLISGLLSWEYRPGSFLYLAYNEGRFDSEQPDKSQFMVLNNRTLILKLSYFFSI
jgi:hypothetical protein